MHSCNLVSVAAGALIATWSAPAKGAPACGDVLGAGHHVLESDLVCSWQTGGLELTSGARLDMDGHALTGAGVAMTGTGAALSNGRVTRANVGVSVSGAGHRISGMSVRDNNDGIIFSGATDSEVVDSDVSANRNAGIRLQNGSNGNRIRSVTVKDHVGTAMIGGIYLQGSHDNVITSSEISGNFCNGILLHDASRNTIRRNVVSDSRCAPTLGLGTNVAIAGDSDENVVTDNDVIATAPGITGDGINLGCKDGCAYQPPTTGADRNVIRKNTVTGHDRYGIAQASGNAENAYERNDVTGNGTDLAIDP